MKRFDLNAMGVQDMSHSEMVKTDGGCGPYLPVVGPVSAIIVATTILKTITETNNGNKDNEKSTDNKESKEKK